MKFELNIADHTYSIPDYYTLGQWSKMNQWDMRDPNDWVFLVADALDIKSPGLIMQLKEEDEKQFEFLFSITISALNLKPGPLQNKVAGYEMIDLEKITLGTFVDLDVLASENKKQDQLFAKLFGMPLEKAKELSVQDALPALQMYTNWRRGVYRAYTALFDYKDYNQGEMDAPEGKSTMTPAHAWYEAIMVLCGGNFRDIEYVVNRPFREAFNFLAWKKTKMLEEQMELNKMKQKMK